MRAILENALRDLRYAARQLGRNRGFAAAAVLILALGIGAVTAIFSVAYAVLIDPFPYKDVQELASPTTVTQYAPDGQIALYTPAQVLAIQRGTNSFRNAMAFTNNDVLLTGSTEPLKVTAEYLTPNSFAVLGVAPFLGRGSTDSDVLPNHPEVMLITYRFWQARFGGLPSVLGKVVTVNHYRRTIIGVMPPRFLFQRADAYLPVRMTENEDVEGQRQFFLLGRLRMPQGEAQAATELKPVFDAFRRADPQAWPPYSHIGLRPFTQLFGSPLKDTLHLLLGAVFALLLIACVNVATLLLARAVQREHEFAVRAALGASRMQLMRFALAEAGLLAALALPASFLVAELGLKTILRLVPTNFIPDEALVTLNLPVSLFAITVALCTWLLTGVLPAFYSAGQQPSSALKQVRVSQSRVQRRSLKVLVTAEIAMCFGLLVLAGLMMRQLLLIEQRPLPFSPEHTFSMQIAPDPTRYPTAASRRRFSREVLQRVAALPEVRAATIDSAALLRGIYASRVAISGTVLAAPKYVALHATDARYQQIASQTLLQGRYLTDADINGRARNAVVSEDFAKKIFPGKSALGRSFHLPDLDEDNDPKPTEVEGDFTIVGIVRGIPEDYPGYAGQPLPAVYLPYPLCAYVGSLLAATSLPAAQLLAPARRAVYAFDHEQVVQDVDTYEHLLHLYGYASPRFAFALFGAFAASALLLTLTGIYGVFSFTTSQRTREFGIRLALGSPRAEVARLVLLGGAKLLAAGIALGVPLALLAGHWAAARDQLAFVSQHDARALAGALALLVLSTLAGIVLPALRAARVDPVTALRAE